MKVYCRQLNFHRREMSSSERNVIMNNSLLTELNLSSSEEFLAEERSELDLVIVIFTSLILGLMILTTIIGKARPCY